MKRVALLSFVKSPFLVGTCATSGALCVGFRVATWLVRRFAEQFWSTESFGMGVFYTLNVFFMQFYLGAVVPT